MDEYLTSVLLTHRLNGFRVSESIIDGLRFAAQSLVSYIEIDTRHTRDNVIIVYHDPFLKDQYGVRLIREMDFQELESHPVFGKDRNIVALEQFLETFNSINCNATLCIDIKDFGLESQYTDLLKKFNLVKKTWIVSWIPEILFRIHHLLPEIKLCFSHFSFANHPWLFNITKFLFNKLDIYGKILTVVNRKSPFFLQRLSLIKTSHDAYNISPDRLKISTYDAGFRHCHFLSTFPQGDLENILSSISGAVTVPYYLIDRSFVEIAHKKGIKVWVFLLDREKKLARYLKQVRPDVVYTNNAYLIPGAKNILSHL